MATTLSVAAQKVIDIEKVEVTSTRRVNTDAVTVTSIDSVAIATRATASFAELLARSTPLFIKSYGLGSLATVSFRGTAASHTAVEWNGINVNSAMLGQVDFSTIPVWFVDKVELLHGGSSLQNGSGALGGSVITGSLANFDKPIYGSFAASAGSFGTYTALGTLGGGGKVFQVKAKYIYQQAKNDFTFRNTAIPPFEMQKQQNADYRKQGVVVDMFLNAGRGHIISISGWYFVDKRNLPPIMSYEGAGRDEDQIDEQARIVAKWIYYGKKFKSELISGYSVINTDYFLANNTDLGRIVNMDSRSGEASIQNRYRFDFTPWGERTMFRGQANVDIYNVHTLDRVTYEGYSAHRTEFGLSFSAHHRFTKVWSGFALVRADDSGQFMPSVGLQALPVEGLAVKFNATRNFHRPTLNDLYWLPGGNPDLRPEKGFSGDIAVNYIYKKSRVEIEASATVYAGLIDDWIIWRPSEYRYWSAENIKTVFNRGAEVALKAAYTTSYDLRYAISGNYAYTRTTNQDAAAANDDSKGKQLIYIPVHKANIAAEASYKWIYAIYAWEYTGERFTTSSSAGTRHTLPAYNLHSFTVGGRLWGFNLELKLDNIFDTQYQAILWRAMPGRNFMAMVRYTF